jgi:hypothetical protein
MYDSKCQKENTRNRKHRGDVQIILTWDFPHMMHNFRSRGISNQEVSYPIMHTASRPKHPWTCSTVEPSYEVAWWTTNFQLFT